MTNVAEKYRVKPKQSISSKELYRRYRNNSLNVNAEFQHSLDEEIGEFLRMDKLQRMNSMKKTMDTIDNLKNKANA